MSSSRAKGLKNIYRAVFLIDKDSFCTSYKLKFYKLDACQSSFFFWDLQISGDYFLKTAALFYQTVCYTLKEMTRRAVSNTSARC